MGFWWAVGMVVVIGLFDFFLMGFWWVFAGLFIYLLIWVFGSGGILVSNGQWWCGGHGGD